jgi:hypothetical protein
VTAIRAAATDGNPETEADPNWLPEVGNTTPDPSYPGAHAVISAAGAEVLTSFFHKDHFEFSVTSEVLAGVRRHARSIPGLSLRAVSDRSAGHGGRLLLPPAGRLNELYKKDGPITAVFRSMPTIPTSRRLGLGLWHSPF